MEIKDISTLLRSLTWRREFQLFILIIICLFGIGMYDNRMTIYESLKVSRSPDTKKADLVISKQNQDKMRDATLKADLIVAIQVIDANFSKNTKKTAYFVTDDPRVQEIYDNFNRDKLADVSLFTRDEKQNDRAIQLINGEYVCVPLNDTLAPSLYIGIEKRVSTICSISIPPVYGRFIGYVSVYLKRPPTSEEKDQIKYLLNEMSQTIYDKDIK